MERRTECCHEWGETCFLKQDSPHKACRPPVATLLLEGFDTLIPQQVTGVKNILRSLDPETGSFVDVEDVNTVNPLKPTITQTYEVGYKGIVMEKLAFSADVYHTPH